MSSYFASGKSLRSRPSYVNLPWLCVCPITIKLGRPKARVLNLRQVTMLTDHIVLTVCLNWTVSAWDFRTDNATKVLILLCRNFCFVLAIRTVARFVFIMYLHLVWSSSNGSLLSCIFCHSHISLSILRAPLMISIKVCRRQVLVFFLWTQQGLFLIQH